MSFSDPIGDMLTRIRNAHMRRINKVSCPASKLKVAVLEVLEREGFIVSQKLETGEDGHPVLSIELKYHRGEPAIKNIKRISKPGRRVFSSAADLGPVYSGLGISILSTSHGVMADYQARQKNVGGELLCQVF